MKWIIYYVISLFGCFAKNYGYIQFNLTSDK